MDKTPPHLVSVFPDSGLTGLTDVKTLRFRFSEKMDRQSGTSWLFFFPDQRIQKTKWHGATEAEIFLEEPLPPDTLVVVEIAAGMRDAHKMRSRQSRCFPLATADTIAHGTIGGILIMDEGPVENGVVELYGLAPDTLEYFQRTLLRRTTTDATGSYMFEWLPVPGGPWLVRGFTDPDFDLRPGAKDAKRLLPDTLSLTPTVQAISAGVTTLYAWNTPGRLLCDAFDAPQWTGQVIAWSMAVGDADTGWTPSPLREMPVATGFLDAMTGGVLADVTPGTNRVVAFVDLDNDSTFSAIPDSLLVPVREDEVRWFLEPHQVIEGVILDPGLTGAFNLAAFGDTLTAWEAPVVADTLAADQPDTLTSQPLE